MLRSILTQQFAKQMQEKYDYQKYERFFIRSMKKITSLESIFDV